MAPRYLICDPRPLDASMSLHKLYAALGGALTT